MAASGVGLLVLMLAFLGGSGNHLLDFASAQAYWKQQNVPLSAEAMLKEIHPPAPANIANDLPALLAEDPAARQQASARILAAGPSSLPQLREAAASPDPQLAAAARDLVARVSAAAKKSEVRRLMAIRALGELKAPQAAPALQPLLQSPDPFVAEYARRALAQLQNQPFPLASLPQTIRRGDVSILPAECRAVLQLVAAGRQTTTIDAFIQALELPPDPNLDKEALLARFSASVIAVAERIGDVRIDALTVGVSGDVGDNAGFVAFILRGQWDSRAIAAALREQRFASRALNNLDIFQVEGFSLLCESNERMLLLAGPRPDLIPLEPFTAALRSGKGGIDDQPDMRRLIEQADPRQPLWAAVKVTDAYRALPYLRPVETLTLTGALADNQLKIRVTASGADPNALAALSDRLNADVQAALANLRPAAPQLPFLKPILQFLESVRCSAQDKNATLTASSPADANPAILLPFFIGLRASHELPAHPQPRGE